MNTPMKLANRFHEVMLNGTWIANTNFKNELENLDWKIATAKFQYLFSSKFLGTISIRIDL